jgi:hypothetical protein
MASTRPQITAWFHYLHEHAADSKSLRETLIAAKIENALTTIARFITAIQNGLKTTAITVQKTSAAIISQQIMRISRYSNAIANKVATASKLASNLLKKINYIAKAIHSFPARRRRRRRHRPQRRLRRFIAKLCGRF